MEIKYFKNREEMLHEIDLKSDKHDFEMTKRNYGYGKRIGLYDRKNLIGAASISSYEEDGLKELNIHTFEISDKFKRKGYGKHFYYKLLSLFLPDVVILEPLDDEAEAFWFKMGFTYDLDNPENMINYL